MANLDVVHVPYKSATQAVTDLLGGQIDFAFVNIPLALPHVSAGKLHALAVTSASPIVSLPGVPTMDLRPGTNQRSRWFLRTTRRGGCIPLVRPAFSGN